MKTHRTNLIAILILTSSSLYAQGKIEVTVKNIQSEKGSIRVGLFASEGDFLKNAMDGKVVKVSGDEIKVVFENLKDGDYAVSVIHDENDNGELDTNGLGIPKEGFAFGNNAMGMFGPPSFEKAKVSVKNSTVKQMIDLKHM